MPSMPDISTWEFLQLKKNGRICNFHNTEEEGGLPLPQDKQGIQMFMWTVEGILLKVYDKSTAYAFLW